MEVNRDEYVELDCDIIVVTDKAVLICDGDTQDWVPLSQVNLEGRELVKGKSQEIEVKQRIAYQKGFI